MRRLTLALAALVVIAAACGGGGEPTVSGTSPDTSGPSTPADATTGDQTQGAPPVSLEGEVDDRGTTDITGQGTADIRAGDFYFDPTFLKAAPGSTVEVQVTNGGSVAHTFTIDGQDVDITLDPEQSQTVSVTIPDSGAVAFICTFHVGQGMQGAFFTEEGASAATEGSTDDGQGTTTDDGGYY